ncbi:hypothetical protein KQI36_10910 [Clostridium senegalense]|uniref:ABC transporter permease n=1 Tax=Clostridium senegalense TaxID=1465809 RepID=UPI001C105F3C|nr:hypothetical protein [Clostridium senegalense]MBU5227150.1 hypothetical protein [Clostridium senegalense]
MKWVEIFKIYSLKQIKKEKILFIFTAISILIATSISSIIPQVSLENKRHIEKNIEQINGGDLSINLMGGMSKELNEKLNEFKNKGFKVTLSSISNCYYKKSSNNIIGSIVIGDYSLKEDEIILQSILANSLNVKVGDFVELDTQGNGKFKYRVKEIEVLSSGVDRDAELLSYGKVQKKEILKGISGREIIHIKGNDGELLKEELLKVDNTNLYTTIDDKKNELDKELSIQKGTLGILSAIGYIFSILAIISTTIMLILKRKKDIAILRLLSIDVKEIKKALRAEISLWLFVPIILSGFFSYYGAKIILKYSGIVIKGVNKESLLLILKGVLFNGIIFFILINIALIIVQGINAMGVIREDEKYIKKQSKKVVCSTIFLIPLFLVIYALYTGSIENLGSSFLVILFIGIFLCLVTLIVKILSFVKIKSTLIMYSIKSINKRFFSFVLVLLSLTLTLWFILIGFNLKTAIKTNFAASLEKILPYNYYVEGNDYESLESVLKNDKDIEGYIKFSYIEGKIINENFKSIYKYTVISEVNKEDYGLNYKIIQGKDLFQGEEGFIISDEMRERNRLNIGDTLEIETKKGIIESKIKGIYQCGGINSGSILKENVQLGDEVSYLVKSNSDKFIDKLNNSAVGSIEDIGDGIAANIDSFLKVFKMLSIICILGTVLFNINIVYMNCIKDEKDEEILMALGLGKVFVIKVQIVKMIFLILLSSILSLEIYTLIVKLFFKVMLNSSSELLIRAIVINLVISIIISIISFAIPLRKILKKEALNLLREGI